jgi:membrane protease YdiL (CAAX protease family)
MRLGASVLALFLLLHASATVLGSFRGEAGVAVTALVLAGTLIVQREVYGDTVARAGIAVGLGKPTPGSLWIALAIGFLLLLTIPAVAAATNERPSMYPGWPALLPGLFAQAGVAEETLFRGYLFGNLRRSHPFWKAAWISAGVFVAAHLLLFATMSWEIAAASTLLALAVSFPLSHLFELGGRTIWAPAIVHFVIQGGVKVVEMLGSPMAYQMSWLAACAAVPWLALAFPSTGQSDTPTTL